jgi:hypothetical protein
METPGRRRLWPLTCLLVTTVVAVAVLLWPSGDRAVPPISAERVASGAVLAAARHDRRRGYPPLGVPSTSGEQLVEPTPGRPRPIRIVGGPASLRAAVARATRGVRVTAPLTLRLRRAEGGLLLEALFPSSADATLLADLDIDWWVRTLAAALPRIDAARASPYDDAVPVAPFRRPAPKARSRFVALVDDAARDNDLVFESLRWVDLPVPVARVRLASPTDAPPFLPTWYRGDPLVAMRIRKWAYGASNSPTDRPTTGDLRVDAQLTAYFRHYPRDPVVARARRAIDRISGAHLPAFEVEVVGPSGAIAGISHTVGG